MSDRWSSRGSYRLGRRALLERSACVAAVAFGPPLACGDESIEQPPPVTLSTTGRLEDAAAWIASASEDELFEGMVGLVNDGLTVTELYAATFLAALRRFPQDVLDHALLWVTAAEGVAGGDRAIAVGSVMQLRRQQYAMLEWIVDNWGIAADRLPEPGQGDANPSALVAAIEAANVLGAERAAVALLRDGEPASVIDTLWSDGCRSFNGFGHKQIACALYVRAIERMGWEHAEGPIRGLARRLARPDAESLAGEADHYDGNASREPPSGWESGEVLESDTQTMLEALRLTTPTEAAQLVEATIVDASPIAVWDAITIHSVEAVLVDPIDEIGFNLHRATTVNALRTGYEQVSDARLRYTLLLQAASFVRWFPLRGPLRPTIDALASTSSTATSIEDVLGMLDAGGDPTRETRLEAARELVKLLDAQPELETSFRAAVARQLLERADDAHHTKYAFAVLEDVDRMQSELRTWVLATTLLVLPAGDVLASTNEAWTALEGLV